MLGVADALTVWKHRLRWSIPVSSMVASEQISRARMYATIDGILGCTTNIRRRPMAVICSMCRETWANGIELCYTEYVSSRYYMWLLSSIDNAMLNRAQVT